MMTVFYDGKCGFCRREIHFYQKIAPSGVFHWCDITLDETELNKHGITIDAAMASLHAINGSGQIICGFDSFLLIWSQLPYFRLLAFLLQFPPMKWVMSFAYQRFAKWRAKRQTICKIEKKR